MEKEKYLKPECSIYETELEGCILSASSESVNVEETTVNEFLLGREYDSSVF